MGCFKRGLVYALLLFLGLSSLIAVPTVIRWVRLRLSLYRSKQEINSMTEDFVSRSEGFIEKVGYCEIDQEGLYRLELTLTDLESKWLSIESSDVLKFEGFEKEDVSRLIIEGNDVLTSFWMILENVKEGTEIGEYQEIANSQIDRLNQTISMFMDSYSCKIIKI